MTRTALLPLLLTAGIALAAGGALAQVGGIGGPNGAIPTPGRGGGKGEKPEPAPPDAVPGSKPRTAAAPATKPVGDMEPNEALFDAINRGDVAAAREALNRGASLSAVNVLGLTPMELSVDLGRNEISFLLLSMRGEDSGRGARAVARGPEGAPPSGRGARPAAAKPVAEAQRPVAKPAAPKVYASDPGTPLPSAGFLGFGRQGAN